MPIKEIAEYEKLEGAEINKLKIELANYATILCHGEDAAIKAEKAAEQLFASGSNGNLSDIPSLEIDGDNGKAFSSAGLNGVDLLLLANFAKSKGEARRLIKGGGAKINDKAIANDSDLYGKKDFIEDNSIKVSAGKKRHILLKF